MLFFCLKIKTAFVSMKTLSMLQDIDLFLVTKLSQKKEKHEDAHQPN